MIAKITAIYRTGNPRLWTVALSCGHKLVVPNASIKAQQLFVGKGGVPCPDCTQIHATLDRAIATHKRRGAA